MLVGVFVFSFGSFFFVFKMGFLEMFRVLLELYGGFVVVCFV